MTVESFVATSNLLLRMRFEARHHIVKYEWGRSPMPLREDFASAMTSRVAPITWSDWGRLVLRRRLRRAYDLKYGPIDTYDIEYALLQLRCLTETIERLGAIDMGLTRRPPVMNKLLPRRYDDDFPSLPGESAYPDVQEIGLGSLRLVVVVKGVVQQFLGSFVELTGKVLETDVQYQTHDLEIEARRMQLRLDILKMEQEYQRLLEQAMGNRPHITGQLEATSVEVLEAGTVGDAEPSV